MLRAILWFTCLAVALPVGRDASAAAGTAASARADEVAPKIWRTTWRELSIGAGRHLGRRICLDVQFHSWIESWNPYLTRFGTRDYRAIRAWADEQFPWLVAEHESPSVRFFVRRASACDETFAAAQVYGRYEITGVVREYFAGELWIEIESAQRLPEHISEATVIHAGRAIELLTEGQWKLADAELERALASPLPHKARAELERLRAYGRDAQVQEKPRDALHDQRIHRDE